MTIALAELTCESFTQHVATKFSVGAEGHQDVLVLLEAVPLRNAPTFGSRIPFSLIFKGARADLLFDQQLLTLRHEIMGDLDVMITPVGRNSDGTFVYQAVFS